MFGKEVQHILGKLEAFAPQLKDHKESVMATLLAHLKRGEEPLG